MALVPQPLPFEPDRFRTAAAHYEEGRVPYSPDLIRRVAAVTGLGTRHRLLDLGCGPGPLARAFAPRVAEVVAMDPSEDMLAAARTLASGDAKTANIRFVAGSSYDLGPGLGPSHSSSWAARSTGWIEWTRCGGSTG